MRWEIARAAPGIATALSLLAAVQLYQLSDGKGNVACLMLDLANTNYSPAPGWTVALVPSGGSCVPSAAPLGE